MIRTNPLTIEQIQIICKRLRKYLNITEDDYFPISQVIDYLFEHRLINYQVLEDDNPRFPINSPSIYDAYENCIYIKESAIEELDGGNYRNNFTLCHELFHFIQTQIFQFDFQEDKEVWFINDPEWQANEFAGQILIPESKLYLDGDTLVDKYRVSL